MLYNAKVKITPAEHKSDKFYKKCDDLIEADSLVDAITKVENQYEELGYRVTAMSVRQWIN